MSQVTLYLDETTQKLLESAVQGSGLSKSRWVADLIRTHVSQQWPQAFLAAAGSIPDFPLRNEAAASGEVADVPRVGL